MRHKKKTQMFPEVLFMLKSGVSDIVTGLGEIGGGGPLTFV